MIRIYNIYHIEHRNLETRKTRNDFLVQVQNFLLPLSLKVLRHKKRDTHSFYSGFSMSPPTTRVTPATKDTGLASTSKRKSTVFFRGRTQLNWLFQNPPKSSARALLVHDVIHIHWSTFLSDFYFDVYERHILSAHPLTPALKFAPN